MPGLLAWDRLRNLPGAPERIFESLCRAIVQRNYSRYGPIRSRRNQPGVEFFLRINRPCDLGDVGRIYGWSCKWFELPQNNRLSSGRRDQISDSIEKAIGHVDGLTDFVLCLPELPAQADLDWYFDLAATEKITLHLWADEELEARMTGGAEVLRRTFFAELIATPSDLADAHQRSVAPVERRWVPGLNVATHVERSIGLALARPGTMNGLRDRGVTIVDLVKLLRGHLDDADGDLGGRLEALAEDMVTFAEYLTAITDAVDNEHPIDALELIDDRQIPRINERDLHRLARECRRRRSRLALIVESFASEIHDALEFIDDVNEVVEPPMIAVVGAAGHGKTQLAAQLTAPDGDQIAGAFIQGGDLRVGGILDDLAARVPGLNLSRFEDLLEAVDAAGGRAGCRVPVIIDGLTEAERPAEWRQLLEQIVPILDRFRHVLLIVTLRSALREQVIPDVAHVLELDWQDQEVNEIVVRYFEHYLIDPGGAWLPARLFRSPLFVRMYCEAANHERQTTVGVEALPRSLVGVFELYRRRVSERLTSDPPRPTLPPEHVERRLAYLAQALWEQQTRRLPYEEVRALVDDPGMTWDDSLYRRLEDEGVLYRHDHSGYLNSESGILFDRFAGYLISDFILSGLSHDTVNDTLGADELWGKLVGPDAHPLGEDVLATLVGLLPRRFHRLHLWTIAPEQQRPGALMPTLELESDLLDDNTVEQLAEHIVGWPPPQHRGHPFDRLWEMHDAPRHQLNADFLDRLLRSVPLPNRDRTWTEWIRQRSRSSLLEDLRGLISRWETIDGRDERDDLSAVAVAWMLSSTQLGVRDLATKALQRYGRPAPERMFTVAARMLAVDDPYIEERVAAAALGATTFHQMPDPGGVFTRALAGWLTVLKDRYLDGGCSPTSHELIRTYVRASFEFAGRLHPAAVPEAITPDDLGFALPPPLEPIDDDDERAGECDRTFGMDFENYVVGSVIEGRGNYDRDHTEYRQAIAQVRGRVWELGWREALLGEVDIKVADDEWRRHGRPDRTERYGKKYGWIAYYELVGRLDDAGKMNDPWVGGGRLETGDIDPTFPEEPDTMPIELPDWAKVEPADDVAWIRSGEVAVPPELWTPNEIDGHEGPWALVDGFVEHRREGRRVFGFFRTHIVEDGVLEAVARLVRMRPYLGNRFLPECPSHHGIFAGEMPWSIRFEDDPDSPDLTPGHGLLQDRWEAPAIDVELVATDYLFDGERTTTGLDRSYSVPSYGFARAFDLRQLPGTLDLVTLDGALASMAFRATKPWRGNLLYLRKDLLLRYVGERRVVRVAWGERRVVIEWHSPPSWWRGVHDNYEHLWRKVDVLE